MLITIFTPTYNRAHLLPETYNSIRNQNFDDVEWLLVDDGSSDNTEAVVKGWIEDIDNKLTIRYIKKENGGMHSAFNVGMEHAQGTFFILLGDDDKLCDGILKVYEDYFKQIKDQDHTAGVLGHSVDENGTIRGTLFPEDDMITKFPDVFYKYKVKGDKSVAFKTAVLKKYPFPKKEGVSYIKEDIVFHLMGKKYDMLCINKGTQMVSYQAVGLSKSAYSPRYVKGLAYSYFIIIEKNVHSIWDYPKLRIWEYIHLGINSLLSSENYAFQFSNKLNTLVYYLLFPRAFYAYLKIKKHVEKNH